MEQVRATAKIIWEQRFWVLSVIGTLVAVACWYLAAEDLQSRFSSRKGAIDGQFTAIKGLGNEPFHPNEEVIKGDLEQAVKQRENVYQMWNDLYERQHAEVLYWPKDNLDEEFVKHMEGRKFLDNISNQMRNQYWNYIQKRFDALLEIVQARKIAQAQGTGGRAPSRFERGGALGGSPVPGTKEGDYLVDWLDQGTLESQLLFDEMPTSKQIWVTQEDLWVYETLLHVIARTNKQRGATRPDNTAVREIVLLQVGSPAVKSSQRRGEIYMPPDAGAADALGGGLGGDIGLGGGGAMGGSLGADDGSALLNNRYLDPAGQPISGESLSAEFRQLPVHMKLKMDQRWLPQVLLECANAPLPVEVKWIRINPEKARSTARPAPVASRGSVQETLPPVDPNLATVEIQGAVLIYGKPDKELLNVPGVEEENQLAGTSPATS